MKNQKLIVRVKGFPLISYVSTRTEKKELRDCFQKTKLTDFLLCNINFNFEVAIQNVSNDILFSLQKRLDKLHYVFAFVNCAMRFEENYSIRENCLNDVLATHFTDLTLLYFLCSEHEYELRFVQMDLLCNFRSFHYHDIVNVMQRISNLRDAVYHKQFNFQLDSFSL